MRTWKDSQNSPTHAHAAWTTIGLESENDGPMALRKHHTAQHGASCQCDSGVVRGRSVTRYEASFGLPYPSTRNATVALEDLHNFDPSVPNFVMFLNAYKHTLFAGVQVNAIHGLYKRRDSERRSQ